MPGNRAHCQDHQGQGGHAEGPQQEQESAQVMTILFFGILETIILICHTYMYNIDYDGPGVICGYHL